MFLVERAHALRAPYMRRSADWIWLLGMLSIAGGFGSIAICGFLWPIADLSLQDGRCRVGLPLKVTIPLLTFDIIINTALTGTFIYLLKPLLRFGGVPHSNALSSRFTQGLRKMLKANEQSLSSDVYPMNQNFLRSIEALLWKTLIGSVLVMLPTVGNIAGLYTLQGRELGWLCLTVCTCDSTVAAIPFFLLVTDNSHSYLGSVHYPLAYSGIAGRRRKNSGHVGTRVRERRLDRSLSLTMSYHRRLLELLGTFSLGGEKVTRHNLEWVPVFSGTYPTSSAL